MPAHPVYIASYARSAVVPVGGAFKALHAHDIGAHVLRALLAKAGLIATRPGASGGAWLLRRPEDIRLPDAEGKVWAALQVSLTLTGDIS